MQAASIKASNNQPETDRFVELTNGNCYFRYRGPRQGPVLLMIHGATVPGWEFDRLAPLLQQAGFRTLIPDLYGHGLSARPHIRYDYRLFNRQIEELLLKLEINRPVDIFGHSMGAAIAAEFTQQNPDAVRRLILAAPLVNFTGLMTSTRWVALPAIGELLMPLYIKPMLIRRRRKRYQNIEDGRWVGMFIRQIKIPGFGFMMLSLLRCDTLGDQSARYLALNRQTHKILVMRGDDDAIMPQFQFEQLQTWLPDAKYISITDTAHAFVITDPEKVAAPIIRFLQTVES